MEVWIDEYIPDNIIENFTKQQICRYQMYRVQNVATAALSNNHSVTLYYKMKLATGGTLCPNSLVFFLKRFFFFASAYAKSKYLLKL